MPDNAMVKLFVDDFRECPPGWTVARTSGAAVRALFTGNVDEVSLDYDVRRCSNKRCRESKDDSFVAVYHYLLIMKQRPHIRIHTGNTERGQAWAEMFGIRWEGIYDPANYE
jgi:hypothetical protein